MLTHEKKAENLIWKTFDKKVEAYQPSGTVQSRAIIEIQRYLEGSPISRKNNFHKKIS